MKQIKYLIRKELIQAFRQRPMVGIIFVMPMIMLFVLGYAVTTDVKHLSTVLCDLDNSAKSRELIRSFRYSGYFDLNYYESNPQRVRHYLDSGEAVFALVIPYHFARDIQRNLHPAVQLIVDGQDANTAGIAMGYANAIVGDFAVELIGTTVHRSPKLTSRFCIIEPEIRVWYNPNLLSVNYMIPAIVVILLTMITSLLSGMAIVREREIGTLEQLMVTPIKPWQLIVGKIIPFAILGIIEFTIVMTIGKLWYHIPIAGNIFLLFGFTLIFLLTTLGLGIFVSTITTTQQQAMFFTWFFNIFFIIMSGFFIPIENMPKLVQYITYLNPVRYFMTIVREIFLKGTGFDVLWFQGLILLILGLVILSLSVMRFRKRVS